MNKKGETWGMVFAVAFLIMLIVAVIGVSMWGMPKYRIYRLDLSGQADLREAEWTKKIMVEEAKAEKDAAVLKAESDVVRAKGIAEANEIIAKSLTEEYIRWKWVEGLHDGSSEVVYIPTEAGLPILEARVR